MSCASRFLCVTLIISEENASVVGGVLVLHLSLLVARANVVFFFSSFPLARSSMVVVQEDNAQVLQENE